MIRIVDRRAIIKLVIVLGVAGSFFLLPTPSLRAAEPLPTQISDEAFWKMVTEMSEPDGFFQFENFLSNELGYQYVIPDLLNGTKPGGVYLGVGPEQNFTYIAALKPKIAVIIDIRRQNMIELLMYKAIFETSETRADFVSKLFARRRPAGLSEKSTAAELFNAYNNVKSDNDLYQENLQAMRDLLVKTRKFGLRQSDLEGSLSIEYVYKTFVQAGPFNLDYSIGGAGAGGNNPNYADLMQIDDRTGVHRSFLATEENYRFVRDMQRRNLIIPLVGDFAGPRTIRSVAQYLKDHDAVVTAFYLSNVEQYLFNEYKSPDFYNNVATLPLDQSSMFIRSFTGSGAGGFRFTSTLSSMTELLEAFKAGGVRQYGDVRNLSR